jgi:Dolichyl-phosphate-mannose-protein mannosyltransferase
MFVPTRHAILLSLLAIVFTGLNAVKPLHIDDAAYSYYSARDAAHPLDPYGFEVLWYYEPQSADEVMAPPVLPYCWALGRVLFGERPWLWKLAMLPWCLLLVWAVYALLRRFAPGVELPMTVLTVLSPALLPSLNLMLDIPALALSLASIHWFLTACDHNSYGKAVLAGLAAGVAMETKYTGALAPAVMLLAAATMGRWRLWPAAAVTAAQVFISWEFIIALLYGKSHFLYFLRAGGGTLAQKAALAPLFLSTLGGLAPVLIVVGLAALGVRRRWLTAAVGVVLIGLALIVVIDADFTGVVRPSPKLFGLMETPAWSFQISEMVFDCFAAAGVAVLIFIIRRLRFDAAGERRDTWFLLLWLALEALAYFPLTPFPAARRVLGPLIVLTLLTARLAALTCAAPEKRRVLWALTGCGAALGLAYFALDAREAYAEKWGAEASAAWIAAQGDDGHTWYVGHYGFQYYAERCGMSPAYAASDPAKTPRLRRGDWLVRPDERVGSQDIDFDSSALREEKRLTLDDAVPLRTVSCFYCGRAPLEHHEGPRMTVRIYRVIADYEPKNPAASVGAQSGNVLSKYLAIGCRTTPKPVVWPG